ncbi:MAG: type 2 isopentenyl-diphosphate Delta-isomerase [Egibacteraceae bacterium]
MALTDTPEDIPGRKRDHLRLSLTEDVGFAALRTGLDELRVRPRALPERDLDDVDLGIDLWGRRLASPLLISCMTGGISEAGAVNRALAQAAQAHRIALGLGSGRVVLGQAADLGTFRVRDLAPDVLLMANLGAVQLHTYGLADCARLVAACEADVLVLHLNAVQEAIQPGGQTEFGGVREKIAEVCADSAVPVVVKEVGFGMSPADVVALLDAGVAGVDVAGAGGTNWARVEGLRDHAADEIARAFADWGLPTAECVRQARGVLDAAGSPAVLIGSGGVRHGVDALKVLCLGADLAGIARGLLAAGSQGPEAATHAVGVLCDQLRIGAWAAGAGSAADLGPALLHL